MRYGFVPPSSPSPHSTITRSLVPWSPSRISLHRNRLARASSSAGHVTAAGLTVWKRKSASSDDKQGKKGLGMGMEGTPGRRKKARKTIKNYPYSLGIHSTPKGSSAKHSQSNSSSSIPLSSLPDPDDSDEDIVPNIDDLSMFTPAGQLMYGQSRTEDITLTSTIKGKTISSPIEQFSDSEAIATLFPGLQDIFVPLHDIIGFDSRETTVEASVTTVPNITVPSGDSSKRNRMEVGIDSINGVDLTVPLNDSMRLQYTPMSVQASSKLTGRRSTPYVWRRKARRAIGQECESSGEDDTRDTEHGRSTVTVNSAAFSKSMPLLSIASMKTPSLDQRMSSPWLPSRFEREDSDLGEARAPGVPLLDDPFLDRDMEDAFSASQGSEIHSSGDEEAFTTENDVKVVTETNLTTSLPNSAIESAEGTVLEHLSSPPVPSQDEHDVFDLGEKRVPGVPLLDDPFLMMDQDADDPVSASQAEVVIPDTFAFPDSFNSRPPIGTEWEDPFGFYTLQFLLADKQPRPFQPSSRIGTPTKSVASSPVSFSPTLSATSITSLVSDDASQSRVSKAGRMNTKKRKKGAWRGAELMARMGPMGKSGRLRASEDDEEAEDDGNEEDEEDSLHSLVDLTEIGVPTDDIVVTNSKKRRVLRGKRLVQRIQSESELRARQSRMAHYIDLQNNYKLHVELVLG